MAAALEMLSAAAENDSLAWALCLIGGALGGSYPIFVKVPRVLDAKVNPVIFQCYKSFWVFALSWIFLLINYLRGKTLLTFTYWGIVGASLWVPAGLCYIAAVPLCGSATTAVLNTGVNSVIQFVVSISTDQTMITYGSANIPRAPFYLAGLILGMMGLILAPSVQFSCWQRRLAGKGIKDSTAQSVVSTVSSLAQDEASLLDVEKSCPTQPKQREYVTGVLIAMLSGTLGGSKFAITNVAHSIEKAHKTPEEVKIEFNVFESYMISFGIGAAVSTGAMLLLFCILQKGIRGKELPSPEFPVMRLYGTLAGCLWFCHYMCLQGANNLGGSGSFGPAGSASQLITAGLWGLLYYREVRDPRRILCWVLSAAWTIVFVVLLSGELKKRDALFMSI